MINYYQRSSAVSFVQWESDTVLYCHGSACTHIISNVSVELLNIIFSGEIFSDHDLLKLMGISNPDNSRERNNKYCHELKLQLINKELIESI